MKEKDFDPQLAFERFHRATNIAGRTLYKEEPEEKIDVRIFPDKNVSPTKFIPNKTVPGTFRANPSTIRAMRGDIFVGARDELFDELEYIIKCKCNEEVDVQFWKHCPYCESSFPKNLEEHRISK